MAVSRQSGGENCGALHQVPIRSAKNCNLASLTGEAPADGIPQLEVQRLVRRVEQPAQAQQMQPLALQGAAAQPGGGGRQGWTKATHGNAGGKEHADATLTAKTKHYALT